MRSPRLATRLGALSKRLGPCCPGCAGRDLLRMYFHFEGCLRDKNGNPVDGSVLEPCRVCGKDERHGVKVIVGIDPARI